MGGTTVGPLGAAMPEMPDDGDGAGQRELSSNLRWAASKAIETKDTYNNGRAQTHTHTHKHTLTDICMYS